MSRDYPTNTDDMIDPRDVEARIAELEGERDSYTMEPDCDDVSWEQLNPDDAAELKALTDFRDEFSGCDGPLIRETYFKDYAQELAEDIHGKAIRDVNWPFSCIDWEQAARELQMDYTAADFDGVTYYGR